MTTGTCKCGHPQGRHARLAGTYAHCIQKNPDAAYGRCGCGMYRPQGDAPAAVMSMRASASCTCAPPGNWRAEGPQQPDEDCPVHGNPQILTQPAAAPSVPADADRPLSPYYEHPECGFHWHGRDGMDVPIRDGQPVCPRCELRTVRTAVLREAANGLAALGPLDSLVSAPAAWTEAIETLRRMADQIAEDERRKTDEAQQARKAQR